MAYSRYMSSGDRKSSITDGWQRFMADRQWWRRRWSCKWILIWRSAGWKSSVYFHT